MPPSSSNPPSITLETIPDTTTETAPGTFLDAADPGFYLNLMWHQHQPFYPKDADGVYTRPWVRVHATKDYYDMAAMVEAYPNVSVTFNLTPVLLMQLEDLAGGAKDIYWTTTEIPADQLSAEDKAFLLARFFDVNPKIVSGFPRFAELADRRSNPDSWTEADWRDLQVLFNLAWTDPGFLAEETLRPLVEKGRDYTEADKQILLGEHLRIIKEVIPLHTRLWEEGKIEVTTTPFAHPILPLVADTNLATVGDPAALLPAERFRQVEDAENQIVRGLDTAERVLGRRPVGMWPGEGAVAQPVMWLFSKNGVRWVATGEDVLAQSLGLGSFTRDGADTVVEADTLYRPWQATHSRYDPLAMFFRDIRISDQLGFEYSGLDAETAAEDFMARLGRIRDSVEVEAALTAGRPYVVSVILDGENAWENYPGDGKDFLDALYTRLNDANWVQTITPSEYLERFDQPEPLDEVYPASWFQPNFATWIGEGEEAIAWEYLWKVRDDLRLAQLEVDPDVYEAAYTRMLLAEGSDWFWWYGADQDSGDDGYFDRSYRELLGGVYDALGRERPGFVEVPIIAEVAVEPDRTPEDLVTIEIDGAAGDWAAAGAYDEAVPGGFGWAFDRENLYLRVAEVVGDRIDIYLGVAGGGEPSARTLDGAILGFGANKVVVWDGEAAGLCDPKSDYHPEACQDLAAAAGEGLEVAIPLAELGTVAPGDAILAKVVAQGGLAPTAGPMAFQVPDISDVAVFLEVEDPVGDDHGPGSYTYPTDAVFTPGSYDLTRFSAGTEGDELVLAFEVVAPVLNPWGSPRGLSVQTFDVYIDTDPGAGTGVRLLLPGRNAALVETAGWEQAITVEGWDPAIYLAGEDGAWEETKPSFDVVTFGDRVVIRIPAALLPAGDPAGWGYAAVVMSQEGFPSAGVRRIRDVAPVAQQWQLGGAPAGINHTRILDVATPTEHESLLSGYPAVASGSVDDLGPDDFGQVALITAG